MSRPACRPGQQVVDRVIELVDGDNRIHESPLQCGLRIDGIARQGKFERTLAAEIPL